MRMMSREIIQNSSIYELFSVLVNETNLNILMERINEVELTMIITLYGVYV